MAHNVRFFLQLHSRKEPKYSNLQPTKKVRLGVVRVTGRFIAWSTVWTGDKAVALDRLEVYMKVRACFGIRGQSIPRKAPGRAYSSKCSQWSESTRKPQ